LRNVFPEDLDGGLMKVPRYVVWNLKSR
jgi:hypothetical protein